MVGVLLSGLRRFHELTDDERVAACIVRGAHWLIASTYDEDRGLFRYTTCPKKRQPDPEYTVPVLDGLVYANTLAPDSKLSAIIERGFDDLGLMRGRLGHLGFGKALCWQTRFVPTVLAYWSLRTVAGLTRTTRHSCDLIPKPVESLVETAALHRTLKQWRDQPLRPGNKDAG